MTEFWLIVGGLVLGGICLGVGYLLGKKNKVKAQIQDAIGQGVDVAKVGIDQAAGTAKDVIERV